MLRSTRESATGLVVASLLALVVGCRATPAPDARTAPGTFDAVVELVEREFHAPELLGHEWQASVARHRAAARAAGRPEGRARAIRGLLRELGASHTAYYTPLDPEYYELLDLFREGPTRDAVRRLFGDEGVRYETLGVRTVEIDGAVIVRDVLEGSPADGRIAVGDRLLAVEGEPFGPVRSLAGRAGRTVRVTVQRRPEASSRAVVELAPVRVQPEQLFLAAQERSARAIEHEGRSIAYVRLRSWASPRYQEALVEQLARPALAACEALVLDLRGGWGGANSEYLVLFDARVPELSLVLRGEPPTRLDRTWRKPVVLLVDETSRSGKEVIAWAFRRHAIGPVVGARTAGAVLAGRPYVLEDGTLLYLAVGDVRVDGERLEGVGVEPDVPVERPLPYCAGRDPQLEAALRTALAELARAD